MDSLLVARFVDVQEIEGFCRGRVVLEGPTGTNLLAICAR